MRRLIDFSWWRMLRCSGHGGPRGGSHAQPLDHEKPVHERLAQFREQGDELGSRTGSGCSEASSGVDSEGNGKAGGRFLERQGVDTVVQEEDPSLTVLCGVGASWRSSQNNAFAAHPNPSAILVFLRPAGFQDKVGRPRSATSAGIFRTVTHASPVPIVSGQTRQGVGCVFDRFIRVVRPIAAPIGGLPARYRDPSQLDSVRRKLETATDLLQENLAPLEGTADAPAAPGTEAAGADSRAGEAAVSATLKSCSGVAALRQLLEKVPGQARGIQGAPTPPSLRCLLCKLVLSSLDRLPPLARYCGRLPC
jgi:hypothetical protein